MESDIAVPASRANWKSAKEELMTIDKLLASTPVITDGAWGTQLQARGLRGGACPDHWNLSHPEVVEEVPRAYVEAGSQLVLTNTFRANRVALAGYGLADQVVEINHKGVEISLRAARDRAVVFASMGPSGKMLIAGEISSDELAAAFTEQARALAEAGAEGIVIETMAELEEAELALGAAIQTGLPVVACVVFDSGPHHDCTMMGVTPEQAAQRLAAMGADVVGANCGQGIQGYIDICRRMRAVTDKPLWIKANAGLPDVVGGEVVYRTTAEQFAAHAPALRDAGAQFIGGCCGTSPEFIAALRKELIP
jgi:5-methyltetrahydrofolate--homocysteine methyltransferase